MPTARLTPTQVAVLHAVDAEAVYRSDSVPYRSFQDLGVGYGRRNVTAIIDRLASLDLIELGEQLRFRRRWQITAAGRAVLAEAHEAVARRRNPTT